MKTPGKGKRDGTLLGLLVGCGLQPVGVSLPRRRQDPNARRSLGDSGSRRQAQEASPGARSGLGERPIRSLDASGEDHRGGKILRAVGKNGKVSGASAPPRFGKSCCITLIVKYNATTVRLRTCGSGAKLRWLRIRSVNHVLALKLTKEFAI